MSGVCAVTGVETPLGERLVVALQESGRWETRRMPRMSSTDIQSEDSDQLSGVSTLIIAHLADYDSVHLRRISALENLRSCLATASVNGIGCVVLVSSAMVYGAWPNNPVPLTEDSGLRPDPKLPFTQDLVIAEQLLEEWKDEKPGRRIVVLRSVPIMSASTTSSLVRALAAGLGTRSGEDDAPAQFVHIDDLISAIVLVMESPVDGILNVAPDGAIPGDTLRALSGTPPRVRLPKPIAELVADLRWKFQRGPIPPGLRQYVHSPWVVSNGALRELGWEPTVTNEQAFVEGTESKWWTMLTPKRKQEISLAVMIAGGIAVLLALSVLFKRLSKKP